MSGATIKPVRFAIEPISRGFQIVATMSDGSKMSWGKDIRTERGAKARMTTFEKRCGLK